MKALGHPWRCQKRASVTNGDHGEVRWNGEFFQAEGIMCQQLLSTFHCVYMMCVCMCICRI